MRRANTNNNDSRSTKQGCKGACTRPTPHPSQQPTSLETQQLTTRRRCYALRQPMMMPSMPYCVPELVLMNTGLPLPSAPMNGTPRMMSYNTPDTAMK